ncbi:MAG: aldo/keto reductase [Candidatus Rokuibacteriota bacterium]|nr:MAG: aldo/keto reductase [Candidatus Rokubacteria bacterium]
MAKMMGGRATVEGTRRYTQRFTGRLAAEHFRELEGGAGAWLSTLGLGTYLGPEDGVTDVLYQDAVLRSLALGVNVIDTAVNYRHQRSERAIRTALATAIAKGVVGRDEVVVATKGGFISFDGAVPRDPRAYFAATYVDTGIIKPGEVVRGAHCMSPRYLRDQIDRSRANLGLETLDVYYLHNPETQLDEVERAEFIIRIRAAFEALEAAVSAGGIARYGTATWTGLCVDPGAPDYLSLAELVSAARDVGGNDHHFKVIQLPYNLGMTEAFTRANQRVNDRMVPVLEAARQLGVYVMASASVHQGQLTRNLPPLITEYIPGLTSDAQRALQFVRSTPGVGTALVGMRSPEHVEENTRVGALPPMGWEHFQRLFSAAGG